MGSVLFKKQMVLIGFQMLPSVRQHKNGNNNNNNNTHLLATKKRCRYIAIQHTKKLELQKK